MSRDLTGAAGTASNHPWTWTIEQDNVREKALRMAIDHSRGVVLVTEDLIKIAEAFEKFLRGQK